MGIPEIVDFGLNFAVMVRVQGPDPKGLKMRKHAFHLYNSGKTTLSASGMLLPDTLFDASIAENVKNGTLVVTIASVVEQFLSAKHRQGISQAQPELIPGVQIDIMVEGNSRVENNPEDSEKLADRWIPAELLTLIDVPISSNAVQSLFDASSGSAENRWEFGWSLTSDDSAPQPVADVANVKSHLAVRNSDNPNLMGKSITRIALLTVSSRFFMDLPDIAVSNADMKGDLLIALGSPFGVLSPVHFFNSIVKGSIANCYPSSSSTSLLMADMRSLPGMEGGPVFNAQAHLVGILTRPARQKSSGAEIQLVIPWDAIAIACGKLLLKETRDGRNRIEYEYKKGNLITVKEAHPQRIPDSDSSPNNFYKDPGSSYLPSFVDKAVASVCLVTVHDAAWASGVLLNDKGLILTNAHLLEPWRFGKTTTNGGRDVSIYPSCYEGGLGLTAESSSTDTFILNYKGHGSIRVRLDHKKPWIWVDARVVYISRGPLDVALLQLDFVPEHLCPIIVDFVCPSQGSKAYVIGHGLFGPRCDTSPSVTFGVVAKVISTKMHKSQHDIPENTSGDFPAMLETTASVHPGGSGGAVVNSDGYMIGLVTSNARHGGGTIIPHLNFSIPCAALAPIFKFSKDMQDLSILTDLDKPNKQLSAVWALMPPLSPRPGPGPVLPKLLPEESNKEAKGSRFAKFISERRGFLKNSAEHDIKERLSNVNIRSKL